MEDTGNKQMKHGYCKALYNQRNKDEIIISVIKKKIIWRTHYIKASENTEQGTVIQMYSLQHAQANKYHDYNDDFYRARNLLNL
jgi:hypothetical protein